MSAVVIAETVRRHLTSAAYWGFVAFAALVAIGTARFNTPAAMWPTLITLLSIITGSAIIGPEFSSGTLQLILVKPLTRAAYLLSRVAGVVLVVWIAAVLAAAVELVARAAFTGNPRAEAIGTALVNAGLGAVWIVALLAFFGSFTRAYFNVAIYVSLQVFLSVGIAVTAASRMRAVATVIDKISSHLLPEAPRILDTRWTLIVLSNAAVALVLACLIFRKREVPYGAD